MNGDISVPLNWDELNINQIAPEWGTKLFFDIVEFSLFKQLIQGSLVCQ